MRSMPPSWQPYRNHITTMKHHNRIPILLFLILAFLLPAGSYAETDPATLDRTGYFSEVFGTADDSGSLTCRFLYLTAKHPAEPTPVRAGDSSVLISPEGLVMLVDCGNPTSGKQVVESLRAMGIGKIDIFVASHPHADHIGGFKTVSDAFEIGRVFMNQHEYASDTYREMMRIIRDKSIPSSSLVEGDTFSLGPQVTITCYNPPAGFDFSAATRAAASVANEGSLCLKMTFGASSFLLAGDMYIGSEGRVAEKYSDEIRADIVKMNHHGDSTSNSSVFVSSVRPRVAVAMNEGLLSLTVHLKYRKTGALTFYNFADGAVRVSTRGDGTYEVQSQHIREIENIGTPSPDGHYSIR